MSTPLEALIAQIIEHKHRLDAIREQSLEMAEALALSDAYHGLMDDVREMCNPTPAIPQIVPMPYLVRPFWEGPAVYTSDSTAGNIRIVK